LDVFANSTWKESRSAQRVRLGSSESPDSILQESSRLRENDNISRTAQYTGGPAENGVKNTVEKGLDRKPTAQNTHDPGG
jgi:hypothetical protein